MSIPWMTLLIALSLLSAAGSSPATFQDAINQEDTAVVMELPETETIETETDSEDVGVFDFNEVQLAATSSGSSSGSGADSDEKCEDYTSSDGSYWHDSDGAYFDCEWYSQGNCDRYGDGSEYENYTANEACCTCGGGTTGDDLLLERPRNYVVEVKRDSDLLLSVEAEA